MVHTIALVPDMLERQEYIKQTAFRLQMSESILSQELAKAMASNAQKAWKEAERKNSEAAQATAQDQSPAPAEPTPPPAPQSLQPQPEPTLQNNPAEAQEKQLVWLLINFGGKAIAQDGTDEAGNPCTITMRVADVIVPELVENELGFDNPVYQQIFNLYRKAVDEGLPLPDANLFATHSDSLLRNTALTLMLNPYALSPLWHERKNIPIPSIEVHLRTDVEETILSFKQKKIDRLLEQNSFELRSCTDEDDQQILMAQRKQLTDLRKAVCEKLHRVVV
jgi:DNA primase